METIFLLLAGSVVSDLGFINKSQLYNVDETPFFLPCWMENMNSSGNKSPNEIKGVHTTVDVSKRFCSIVVTLRADNYKELANGFKSKPFALTLIFKGTGKQMDDEMRTYSQDVHVLWQKKGWFDRDVGHSYAKLFRARSAPGRKVILVDNLDAHIEEDFIDLMGKCDCIVKAFPPNCTHFCQPVDRHVAIWIKNRIYDEFRLFWLDLQEQYKKTNQVQNVNISLLRKKMTFFAAKAFKELADQDNLVRRSFEGSGLSLPVSGVRDDEIAFVGMDSKVNYSVCDESLQLRSILEAIIS
jgi:hypothetical protein